MLSKSSDSAELDEDTYRFLEGMSPPVAMYSATQEEYTPVLCSSKAGRHSEKPSLDQATEQMKI